MIQLTNFFVTQIWNIYSQAKLNTIVNILKSNNSIAIVVYFGSHINFIFCIKYILVDLVFLQNPNQ